MVRLFSKDPSLWYVEGMEESTRVNEVRRLFWPAWLRDDEFRMPVMKNGEKWIDNLRNV